MRSDRIPFKVNPEDGDIYDDLLAVWICYKACRELWVEMHEHPEWAESPGFPELERKIAAKGAQHRATMNTILMYIFDRSELPR